MALYMSHEEICRYYRQAAHKRETIRILAELNLTDLATIREVLIEGGLLNPGTPVKQRGRSCQFDGKLEALDGLGLNNTELAQRVGCSKHTVQKWLRRRRKQAAEAEQKRSD